MDKIFDTMTLLIDKVMDFVEVFIARIFKTIGDIGEIAAASTDDE